MIEILYFRDVDNLSPKLNMTAALIKFKVHLKQLKRTLYITNL